MWRPLLLLLVLVVTGRAEEGLQPLFNGRDLSGWVNVNGAPETWAMREDGVLTCTGKPIAALRTVRQYENFILELEWRHLKSGGNAGIFVWASPLPALGQPFLRAIEVQVLDTGYGNTDSHTTHGDIFAIHGSSMVPLGRSKGMRAFPSESRSRQSPEWNHYRLEARDGTLRLHVNGQEVTAGEQCQWRKGYLGLESEGSPTEWRNVRLQELPSTGAAPEQSAPEAQEHRPLYNGVDLRGWQSATPEQWQVRDWKLVAKPVAGPLWSAEQYGAGEWLLDCQLPEKGNAAGALPKLLLKSADGTVQEVSLEGLTPGAWRRFRIQRSKGELVINIDGLAERRLPLASESTQPVAFGLSTGGSQVTFANVFWCPAGR